MRRKVQDTRNDLDRDYVIVDDISLSQEVGVT
jgi:hypothetical protein